MRRAWWFASLCLMAALAGCVGDDSAPAAGAGDAAAGDGAGIGTDDGGDAATVDAPPQPVLRSIPVDWQGRTGTGVFVCEYETSGVCEDQEVSSNDNGVFVPVEAGTLRAFGLTLSWSAVTPLHDTMVFEVMTMASDCADCRSAMLLRAEGGSPLVVALDGLDLQLLAGQTVHAYAYAGQLFHHEPGLVASARIDQPLAIAGNITLEAAPVAADPHAHH